MQDQDILLPLFHDATAEAITHRSAVSHTQALQTYL